MIALLSAEQLDAVVAHERAHLRQKHHLLLDAFRSWKRALPWFPIATRAQDAVALLVEMLADDSARRAAGDAVLADAIRVVDSTGSAGAALGCAEGCADARSAARGAARARRATRRRSTPPSVRALRLAVMLATVALVVVPPVLVLTS